MIALDMRFCGNCQHFAAIGVDCGGRVGLCRLNPPVFIGDPKRLEDGLDRWIYWTQPMVRDTMKCGQWLAKPHDQETEQ